MLPEPTYAESLLPLLELPQHLMMEMPWNVWLGNALIVLGTIALLIGVVGVLRFKRFTMRALAAAKIDTVAFLLILLGLAVRSGITWFSAKLMLLFMIVIFITPIVSSQTLSRARQDGEA